MKYRRTLPKVSRSSLSPMASQRMPLHAKRRAKRSIYASQLLSLSFCQLQQELFMSLCHDIYSPQTLLFELQLLHKMKGFKNDLSSSQSFRRMIDSNTQFQGKMMKGVLEQCYFTINDLKARNKSLEDQLKLKNSAIDRLILQKQEHALHMSECFSDNLKKQLEISNKKSEEMRQNFERVLDNYEKIIKKYQNDIEKLKGFNKVLRVQNDHLRNEVSKVKMNGRERDKKVGKITQVNADQGIQDENNFQYTVNRSECLYPDERSMMIRREVITPQKFITSKSTNLSTAAKSSNKPQSRKQSIPRNLFHNPRLNAQNPSNRHSQKQSSDDQGQGSAKNQQLIGIWFNRLKKLLAESDEEN